MLPLLSSSCQPPIGNPSHLRKQSKRQEPGSQTASTSTPANPLSITASANSSLTNPFLYTHSLVASVASAPPPPAPPNPIDLRRLQIPGGRRQRAPGGGPPSGARVFALSNQVSTLCHSCCVSICCPCSAAPGIGFRCWMDGGFHAVWYFVLLFWA